MPQTNEIALPIQLEIGGLACLKYLVDRSAVMDRASSAFAEFAAANALAAPAVV